MIFKEFSGELLLPVKYVRLNLEGSLNLQKQFQLQKRETQLHHTEELDGATAYIKQKIRQYDGTEIKSRMEHVLQQWLLESRQLYGQFPVYPTEEDNGSTTLFRQMTVQEVQEIVDK
ncbi:unnamed protein product, partial [Didymodactylos carnosus]